MSALNALPDKKIFESASNELGISPSLIEKDWYVVQILAIIADLRYPGFEIVFSGGTALSKAHNLIKRYSEDIDFRVITHTPSPSRTVLSGFKSAVATALRKAGFAIDNAAIKAKDQNRFFSIDIDYNTNFLRSDALRAHIQLEITINKPKLPSITLPVSSFIALLQNQAPEVQQINCLTVVENAADKLSALAWRVADRVRGDKYDDPTIVRHIYDLAILEPLVTEDHRFPNLTINAIKQDNTRAKNNLHLHNFTIEEKLRLMLDTLSTDNDYPSEYDRFVKGVCYSTEIEIPLFDTSLDAVRKLSDYVISSLS